MLISTVSSLAQRKCIDVSDTSLAADFCNLVRLFPLQCRNRFSHKKDGYSGRKVRPLPPVCVLDKPADEPPRLQKFTLNAWQKNALYGTHKVHTLVGGSNYYF